jgi:hypothetical protein
MEERVLCRVMRISGLLINQFVEAQNSRHYRRLMKKLSEIANFLFRLCSLMVTNTSIAIDRQSYPDKAYQRHDVGVQAV